MSKNGIRVAVAVRGNCHGLQCRILKHVVEGIAVWRHDVSAVRQTHEDQLNLRSGNQRVALHGMNAVRLDQGSCPSVRDVSHLRVRSPESGLTRGGELLACQNQRRHGVNYRRRTVGALVGTRGWGLRGCSRRHAAGLPCRQIDRNRGDAGRDLIRNIGIHEQKVVVFMGKNLHVSGP